MSSLLTRSVWNTIKFSFPFSCNPNISIVDWIDHVWHSWYNKNFQNPLDKIITMAWATWHHMDKVIFNGHSSNATYILQIATRVSISTLYMTNTTVCSEMDTDHFFSHQRWSILILVDIFLLLLGINGIQILLNRTRQLLQRLAMSVRITFARKLIEIAVKETIVLL